jgi:hypothetical protein
MFFNDRRSVFLRRQHSAPILGVDKSPPPNQLMRRNSERHLNSSFKPTKITPTSVSDEPYRKKHVRFTDEVLRKGVHINPRLQGITLNEIDLCGSSVPRNSVFNKTFAIAATPDGITPPSKRKGSNKPSEVLLNRIRRIKEQLVADYFEIEVVQNEVEEFIRENQVLMDQLNSYETFQMGCQNLLMLINDLEERSRRYSVLIAKHRIQVERLNKDSAKMMEILHESKHLLRRSKLQRERSWQSLDAQIIV